jgi:RND family efflux transporter MFP subunit
MSNQTDTRIPPEAHAPSHGLVWAIRLFLAAVIILASGWGYKRLLATAPTRKMRPVSERVAVVETMPLARTSRRVTVTATGTAVAARQLGLNARVSGEVVAVDPALEPGGYIAAGTVAVRLDRTDYELAVKRAEAQVAKARSSLAQSESLLAQAKSELVQAESQVVTAQYSYKIELGHQDVAKHEWEMMDSKTKATALEQELTLRKPHLRKAESDVKSAEAGVAVAKAKIKSAETSIEAARATLHDGEAALEQAKLDLQRVDVKVPFDAVVLERAVSVGAEITTQTQLASLAAASPFWVEVSIPYDRLAWIKVRQGDTPGAKVVLRPSGPLAGQAEWPGEVIRRLPSLEENGRQAVLLVEVSNPLQIGRLPLLLGAFVQAEIVGPELSGVFAIPRPALRNGTEVWVRNAEGRLTVCPVVPEWANEDVVIVRDGLAEGDMLVTSDIASPVPGMQLALAGERVDAETKEAPEETEPKAPRME